MVCVTHLSLTPEDQRASLPIIRTVTDTCRKPVLLAGDFNMKVAKTVLDGLDGAFRPLSDTTQMTFPSGKPSIRLDYILGRGPSPRTTVRCGWRSREKVAAPCVTQIAGAIRTFPRP